MGKIHAVLQGWKHTWILLNKVGHQGQSVLCIVSLSSWSHLREKMQSMGERGFKK